MSKQPKINDGNASHEAPAQTITANSGASVAGVIQGREVIGNLIISGDAVFIGAYGQLRHDYIKPTTVFERVDLNRFVGRAWLVSEIDSFLNGNKTGCFVLEAKAGLGKTTFLAYLVRERKCVHHFVELAPGLEGLASGLKNLAAQLILAWGLEPSRDEILPGRATRPDYLQEVVFEAAKRRDETKPTEKIIIVIDALDEAGVPSGQNVLGLPKILPEGVYLIVSQRPVEIPLDIRGRKVFHLDAGAERNISDTQLYLKQASTLPGVARELSKSGYSVEEFVSTMSVKCGGVWIYLHYIIGEIEAGHRSPLDLSKLPHGVWQYYAQYWRRWRSAHEEAWDKYHLPLLATLAAVQEAASISFLCELAGIAEDNLVNRLLQESWAPFLTTVGPQYRFYHASLQEFFDGRAELSDLTDSERVFTHELVKATRRAHRQIIDRCLKQWGTLEAGLPHLSDASKRNIDAGYGFRFLPAHLEKVGDEGVSMLHSLLRLEWQHNEKGSAAATVKSRFMRQPTTNKVRRENAWYAAHELAGDVAGYMGSVARAWQLANSLAPASGTDTVGLQSRYAFITASLNSLAQNIEPRLLLALMKTGVWSPTQAVSYARQVPDDTQRIIALGELLPHVNEQVFQEVISSLSVDLMQLLFKQIVMNASHSDEPGQQLNVLRSILSNLPESLKHEAQIDLNNLAAPKINSDPTTSIRLSAALLQRDAFFLRPLEDRHVVRSRAWSSASKFNAEKKEIDDVQHYLRELDKAVKTGGDLPTFSAETPLARFQEQKDLHKKELARIEAIWEISNATLAAYVLAKLAHELSNASAQIALQRALDQVRFVKEEGNKAVIMVIIASVPQMPRAIYANVLSLLHSFKDEYWKTQALISLVNYLPADLLSEAIDDIFSLTASNLRTQAVPQVAVRMSAVQLRRALASVSPINDEKEQRRAFLWFLPYVPETQRKQFVSVIRASITNTEENKDPLDKVEEVRAPLALTPYIPELQRQTEIERVLKDLTLLEEIERAHAFAVLAPHLPRSILIQALTMALVLEDEVDRQIALKGLSPFLPEDVLRNAMLSLEYVIQDPVYRVERLASLATIAPATVRFDIIKNTIATFFDQRNELDRSNEEEHGNNRGIDDSVQRYSAESFFGIVKQQKRRSVDQEMIFEILAPSLPEAIRYHDIGKWPSDKYLSTLIVCNLASLQAAVKRDESIRIVLFASTQLADQKQRARLFAVIASMLSNSMLFEAVLAALRIENALYRFFAIRHLSERLCLLEASELYSIWTRILPILATKSRRSLLVDITAMAIVIQKLGGPKSVGSITDAIEDVMRWWP